MKLSGVCTKELKQNFSRIFNLLGFMCEIVRRVKVALEETPPLLYYKFGGSWGQDKNRNISWHLSIHTDTTTCEAAQTTYQKHAYFG